MKVDSSELPDNIIKKIKAAAYLDIDPVEAAYAEAVRALHKEIFVHGSDFTPLELRLFKERMESIHSDLKVLNIKLKAFKEYVLE
ncbi:hypothetical protein KKD19_04745 [Patescibacteria group bacterium]|nr:hypothetical protein [Patescibacteria group bacterium]MBU4512517.1 hypothetical protein [Patescibacteria group bacterium]MCG2693504.1 hypothetical protein [Candidatus Parcubacteria bacterium]